MTINYGAAKLQPITAQPNADPESFRDRNL